MALIIWAASFWQFEFLSSRVISEYLHIKRWKKKRTTLIYLKDSSSGMEEHKTIWDAFSDLQCYWLNLGAWKQNPLVAIFPSIEGYKKLHGSLGNKILQNQAPAYLSYFILHCLLSHSPTSRQGQTILEPQEHTRSHHLWVCRRQCPHSQRQDEGEKSEALPSGVKFKEAPKNSAVKINTILMKYKKSKLMPKSRGEHHIKSLNKDRRLQLWICTVLPHLPPPNHSPVGYYL